MLTNSYNLKLKDAYGYSNLKSNLFLALLHSGVNIFNTYICIIYIISTLYIYDISTIYNPECGSDIAVPYINR